MLAIVFAAAGALNMPCAELKNIELERATITSAVDVAAGLFKPVNAPANPTAQSGPPPQPIPQHCRVTLVLEPTPDSNINVELWLPTENWNGKFLAVGNGGWAGSIQGYGDLQAALRRGYATAATDTGHSAADGPGGMFALGHPEKIVDFAYRALHDMTAKSKRLIDVFYAEPLDYSYYKGCSTGGRQGVMAAQRYPGDYDGIIAGALANRHIHMHTAGSYRSIRLARHPDEAISDAKAKLVNDAVMKQCDTLGEGFLNNPRQCSFDFDTLACPAGKCLPGRQVRRQLPDARRAQDGAHVLRRPAHERRQTGLLGAERRQPDPGACEPARGTRRKPDRLDQDPRFPERRLRLAAVRSRSRFAAHRCGSGLRRCRRPGPARVQGSGRQAAALRRLA
jgi:feruloyl esterase